MRALVVGGGSIGTRHLGNLKTLGVNHLGLVEPQAKRREVLRQEIEFDGFDQLSQGLDWNPDFAIIASPTHLHAEQALEVSRRGYHIFVEKPLSHTSEKLKELAEEIECRDLVSLVACNMRFHPGPTKVKELLEREVIGKILFARVHTGSYLPEWRPGQDYRKSYSASAAMGGGCILDCIHEIDLARWYLGEMEQVFCVAEHLSSFEIDVEDVAILICKHSNGSLSEIHLDYIQRTYERGCQIVGEQGSIFWNYCDGVVRWFNTVNDRWITFKQPDDWQVNQMYLDELQHFVTCVQMGTPTVFPVPEAVEVMRIALAAKASALSGCFVTTRSVVL